MRAINRRELKQRAGKEIAAVVQSMDLSQLFGEELVDEQYLPGGQWIPEALTEYQRQAVSLLEEM